MHYNSSKVKSYIGDVRAYDSIASAMIGIGQTDQSGICVKPGNEQELFFEELM